MVRLFLSLFLLFSLIDCKYFHNDCRRFDSCPSSFTLQVTYPLDSEGKILQGIPSIPKDTKLLLLVPKEDNDRYRIKTIWNDKEVFINSEDVSYKKSVRVAILRGVELKETLDPSPKITGKVEYNASVIILDESDSTQGTKENVRWAKIGSNEKTGWVLFSDLTDGDYDARLIGLSIPQILSNRSVEASEDSLELVLKWRGNNFQNPNCLLEGKTCSAEIYTGREDSEDYLFFKIKANPPGKSIYDLLCSISRKSLVDSFPEDSSAPIVLYPLCSALNSDAEN